VAKLYETISNK